MQEESSKETWHREGTLGYLKIQICIHAGQELLSTDISDVESLIKHWIVDTFNKAASTRKKKSSKPKRSELSFREWFDVMFDDDSITFMGSVISRVEKKYPRCKVFEEPSVQGMQGEDFWSVTLEDGRHYSVEFDFNEELRDMFELGPKRAATQYANEIISQIKSGEALVEDY